MNPNLTTDQRTRHLITLTTGQYDHLYNIMCRQEEILDYLNEHDDFWDHERNEEPEYTESQLIEFAERYNEYVAIKLIMI